MTSLVLLVDDDIKILRLLEATLRLKDFDVVKSETAAEALQWLKTGRPDLIISDTDVPDLDGFDLFRRVRGMPSHVDVPFIFLSAEGEPEDVARGLRAGADEYLRKPFAIDELLARVMRVLQRATGPAAEPPVFSGDLADMNVPDLLRMLSVQRRTGLLRVEPRDVGAVGLLQVDEGHLSHAEFGLLDGVPALFAVLGHSEGSFSFDPDSRLSGDTVSGDTLPLLMEGLGLVDSGQLRRIDPRSLEATRTFRALVGKQRRRAVDASLGESNPLRLQDGRRPGVFAGAVGLDSLDSAEFHVTQRLAPLSDDVGLPTVLDDEEDDVGLNTADFAPAFLTGELEAIEDEVTGRRGWEQETERFAAPRRPDPSELTGQILIVADEDEEYAVALIDDTIADLDINSIMSPYTSGISGEDVMGFYEQVKGVAQRELGAASVQLGTRTGRIIASSIPEVTRRDTVAMFSSQAIMFAAEAPDGTSFAALDAGDLHVVVLEVDHLRVLTLLFGSKPEPATCIAALSPHLEEYRTAR